MFKYGLLLIFVFFGINLICINCLIISRNNRFFGSNGLRLTRLVNRINNSYNDIVLMDTNRVKKSMTNSEFIRFQNYFSKNILNINNKDNNLNSNECNDIDQIDFKSFLSPTVVVAKAIEKLKYYVSSKSSRSLFKNNNQNQIHHYSIIFQIVKIYKYENLIYENINKKLLFDTNKLNNKNDEYFEYLSTQDVNSNQIDLNSFMLIENFTATFPNENNQCNSIDVKLNHTYLLFIDKQNSTLKMKHRRYFTHPIRFKRNTPDSIKSTTSTMSASYKKSSSNNSTKIVLIKSFLDNNLSYFQKELGKLIFNAQNDVKIKTTTSTKTTTTSSTDATITTTMQMKSMRNRFFALVRVPIFRLAFKPIEYSQIDEASFENGLCNLCHNRNYFHLQSIKFKNRLVRAKTGSNTVLECSLDGYHPKPVKIFWFKYYNQIKVNNPRYSIKMNNNENVSTLTIKSVQLNDNGYYYCLAGDYLVKPIPEMLIDKARLVVTKSNNTELDKNDKIISLSNGKHLKNTKITFSITNATPTLSTNASDNSVEKPYLRCEKNENTCENGGVCYKKNRKYFKYYNNEYEDLSKIKICICKEFYEGPNCEIELKRSIVYEQDEIPSDFITLWNKLGANEN